MLAAESEHQTSAGAVGWKKSWGPAAGMHLCSRTGPTPPTHTAAGGHPCSSPTLSQRYLQGSRTLFFPIAMTKPPTYPEFAEIKFSLGKLFIYEQNTAPAPDAGQEKKNNSITLISSCLLIKEMSPSDNTREQLGSTIQREQRNAEQEARAERCSPNSSFGLKLGIINILKVEWRGVSYSEQQCCFSYVKFSVIAEFHTSASALTTQHCHNDSEPMNFFLALWSSGFKPQPWIHR